MASFRDYKKRFKFNIYTLMDKAVRTMKDEIIELNQAQLLEGFDAKGQTIKTIGGNPYSLYTIGIRRKKGLKTDRVDLYFTGAFYKTFRVIITGKGYEVTADFKKDDGSILDNFSSSYEFLGLTKSSTVEWVEQRLFPVLVGLIKKQIGL